MNSDLWKYCLEPFDEKLQLSKQDKKLVYLTSFKKVDEGWLKFEKTEMPQGK